MPNITCKQCGSTGHSKNPATRTVFMDNQMEATFSNLFKYSIKENPNNPDYPTVVFELRYIYHSNDNLDTYEAVKECLSWLKRHMEFTPVEVLACNHDKGWEMDGPPEC